MSWLLEGSVKTASCLRKVVPDTPLDRAQNLVNRVLKEVNHCRDHAFKLRPLGMSGDLISQLNACAVKLQGQADSLQQKIRQKRNRNSDYKDTLREIEEISKIAAERVQLAKALIRASEKARKPKSADSKKTPSPKGTASV